MCPWGLPRRDTALPRWLELLQRFGPDLLPLGGAPDAVPVRLILNIKDLSLSRLNHWLPRIQAHPEVVQGTTEFHHQIADALLPQADPVFHNAAALDTAVDVLNP